jgi:CelD/BcsL family acetyltransferase involved in cellulose biosynthesis
MYFLTSGNTDIAAAILYKQKSIVYGAHITYRPTFAEYSPGVVLTTEILKMLFGSQYHEFDFLGFRNEEKNTLKKNWSTGTRQTIRIEVYKKSGFILLYMIGRRVNKIVQNAMRMMISPTPSKQTQTGSASSPTLTEKQE